MHAFFEPEHPHFFVFVFFFSRKWRISFDFSGLVIFCYYRIRQQSVYQNRIVLNCQISPNNHAECWMPNRIIMPRIRSNNHCFAIFSWILDASIKLRNAVEPNFFHQVTLGKMQLFPLIFKQVIRGLQDLLLIFSKEHGCATYECMKCN